MSLEFQRDVNCPMCDNNNFKEIYNYKPGRYNHTNYITHSWDGGLAVGLKIVKCNDCGFKYQNPIFKDEKLHLLYPESIVPKKINFSYYDDNRYHILWSEVEQFFKDAQSRLSIDIGTRFGALPVFLSKKGFKSVGIEMNKACVNAAKEYGLKDIYCAKIDNLNSILDVYDRKDVDLITMIDVIEHLTNPNEDFKLISSIQKRGQILLLTTMFDDSIGGLLFGKEWYYIHAQHTLYFSRKTIKDFLNKHNYELVKIIHIPLSKSILHFPIELVKYIQHNFNLIRKPKFKAKKWFAVDRPHCLDLMTVIARKK